MFLAFSESDVSANILPFRILSSCPSQCKAVQSKKQKQQLTHFKVKTFSEIYPYFFLLVSQNILNWKTRCANILAAGLSSKVCSGLQGQQILDFCTTDQLYFFYSLNTFISSVLRTALLVTVSLLLISCISISSDIFAAYFIYLSAQDGTFGDCISAANQHLFWGCQRHSKHQ